MNQAAFESLLDDLDLKLFDTLHSQTTDNDKRSLLACQKAVRDLRPQYTFLEIGSYLGGSLQPYVLDERCRKIISIDRRPRVAPDERGTDQIYLNNTTEQMLRNLTRLSPEGVAKLRCIDGDASEVDPHSLHDKADLCFIDGEHTDAATWRDGQFCVKVMAADGAIVFHDATIIYNALVRIVTSLKEAGVTCRAYNLPDTVFVVEIGEFPIHRSPFIAEMLHDNHVGYLHALQFTDQYRRFANRPLFRFVRNLKMKFTRANITK